MKGWACCKKRVISFDDFLAIPGCTVGQHRHVPGAAKPTAGQMGADKGTVAQPKLSSAPAGSSEKTEVYTLSDALSGLDAGNAQLGATPSPAEAPQTETGPKEEDLNDAPDAEVPAGTKCKRKGCGREFSGPESKEEECSVRHHHGSCFLSLILADESSFGGFSSIRVLPFSTKEAKDIRAAHGKCSSLTSFSSFSAAKRANTDSPMSRGSVYFGSRISEWSLIYIHLGRGPTAGSTSPGASTARFLSDADHCDYHILCQECRQGKVVDRV